MSGARRFAPWPAEGAAAPADRVDLAPGIGEVPDGP